MWWSCDAVGTGVLVSFTMSHTLLLCPTVCNVWWSGGKHWVCFEDTSDDAGLNPDGLSLAALMVDEEDEAWRLFIEDISDEEGLNPVLVLMAVSAVVADDDEGLFLIEDIKNEEGWNPDNVVSITVDDVSLSDDVMVMGDDVMAGFDLISVSVNCSDNVDRDLSWPSNVSLVMLDFLVKVFDLLLTVQLKRLAADWNPTTSLE